MRFLFLVLINLSLPFILRWIYLIVCKMIAKRRPAQPEVIDVTPRFPVAKLLGIGLLLLALTLVGYRILGVEIDSPFSGNQARSERF